MSLKNKSMGDNLNGEGRAYFREIVTKEVWQPFWTSLLNMHVGGYVHSPSEIILLPIHFPEHW